MISSQNHPLTFYGISQSSIDVNNPVPQESIYEAYHAVFSALMSTDVIYRQLAKKCGSDFYYMSKLPKNPPKNVIFCKNKSETHYKFMITSPPPPNMDASNSKRKRQRISIGGDKYSRKSRCKKNYNKRKKKLIKN